MKKAMHRGVTPRASRPHGLWLSQETIRVLHASDLSRAASGCVEFSIQSTNQTNKASANACVIKD